MTKHRTPAVIQCRLDAAALRRTTAIVSHRSYITDRCDVEADCGQSAQRGFTTATGALNFDFQGFNTMFLCFFACIFCVIYTALSFGLALFGK